MTGCLTICLVALTLAAGCGPAPTTPPEKSETALPPKETNESGGPKPNPAEEQEVRAVVARYVVAIAARDEAAAAQFTCQKKDGGLLWISSAGKRIIVGRVLEIGDIREGRAALVEIQVEGKPTSTVALDKIDGNWCVWL